MNTSTTPARWPALVALGLLVFFGVMFVTVFLITSVEEAAQAYLPTPTPPSVNAETVARLLENADPARGEPLLVVYGCTACHIGAAGVGIAPNFAGLADRAGSRQPPLTAEEYIYESIIMPRAFIVEGFADSMPTNFADRLSDAELGDVLAYLLTTHAE